MIHLQDILFTPAEHIVPIANNYAIAKNLRDVFPHPYTIDDALSFLELAANGVFGATFGIYDHKTFIGVGSITPQKDVHRINGEIGYWLGELYWGKGFATDAVRLLTQYAFSDLNLLRVYANVFEYNLASMRVLEKAGYKQEALLTSLIIKEGKIWNTYLYSILSTTSKFE